MHYNAWRDKKKRCNTNLCDQHLIRIIRINKIHAQKCRFTVFDFVNNNWDWEEGIGEKGYIDITLERNVIYSISSKSRCSEILVQGYVQCGNISKAARNQWFEGNIYRVHPTHGFDHQLCSSVVCTNIAPCAYKNLAVNPLPCSEISRGVIIWGVARFQGKYSTCNGCQIKLHNCIVPW